MTQKERIRDEEKQRETDTDKRGRQRSVMQ